MTSVLLRCLLPVLLMGCSARVIAEPAQSAAGGMRDEIAAIAKELERENLYPGVSIAASTRSGETITYQMGAADLAREEPVASTTSFRMYSVSKGLTRMLAAVLADKDLLDLDARVSHYLTDLPVHLHPITVRQLLDHTSGIRHYRSTEEWLRLSQKSCASPSQAVSEFSNDPLLFEPGTKESYSSFGYVLLSAVLEKAGGQSFAQLLDTHLVKPSQAQGVALDTPNESEHQNAATFYERRGANMFDVAPAIDNSCKFGGGAVNASPLAILQIYQAFYAGGLTSPEALRDHLRSSKSAGEGAHVSVGGEGLGGRSVAVAYPNERVFVVIAANARGGNLEPYARRIADTLLASSSLTALQRSLTASGYISSRSRR